MYRVRTFRVSSWPGPAACCRNRPRRPDRPRRRSAAQRPRVCGAARTGVRVSGGVRSSRSGPRRHPAAAAARCAGVRPARPRAPAGPPPGPWASGPSADDALPSVSPPRSHPARWPYAGPRPTVPAPAFDTGRTTLCSWDNNNYNTTRVDRARDARRSTLATAERGRRAGCTAVRKSCARSSGACRGF